MAITMLRESTESKTLEGEKMHVKYCASVRNRFVSAAAVVLACGLATVNCVSWAQNTTLTRAFYYDQNNVLLQVENLFGVNLTTRTLTNVQPGPLPPLTENTMIQVPCTTGDPQPLDSRARFAIYYGVRNIDRVPGARDLKAMPLKRENTLSSRNIQCLEPDGNHTCPPGKFCHCLTSCTLACCW